MKQAFKKSYDLINPEKYRLFLKKNLLKLNPTFYSVSGIKAVQTTSGLMYAVRIVREIENPHYEPIAECWINNEYIYLWRDQCWVIAVDKNDERIWTNKMSPADSQFGAINIAGSKNKINVIPPSCNKTMLIHCISESNVLTTEELENE